MELYLNLLDNQTTVATDSHPSGGGYVYDFLASPIPHIGDTYTAQSQAYLCVGSPYPPIDGGSGPPSYGPIYPTCEEYPNPSNPNCQRNAVARNGVQAAIAIPSGLCAEAGGTSYEVFRMVSVQLPTGVPHIENTSPNSDIQGASGQMSITGSNLVDVFGNSKVNFHGLSGTGSSNLTDPDITGSVTTANSAAPNSVTVQYHIDATAPVGTHYVSIATNFGESDNFAFTVLAPPPPPPPPPPVLPVSCSVGLRSGNSSWGYSTIASTGAPSSGTGTMTVSFTGAAFALVSQTVTYGPYSTPSSIASNIAAMITYNYGLTKGLYARAFGPTIIYSSSHNVALGTAFLTSTGGTFATDPSATAAGAAAECPPSPSSLEVQYRAYIPADNLVTTVPCWVGQKVASPFPPLTLTPIALGLIMIMGDNSFFSTRERIYERVDLSLNSSGPATEPPIQTGASTSYNFSYPTSPAHGMTISQSDFNNPLNYNCVHEQAVGHADMSHVGGSTFSLGANQASVTFTGSASDPLFENPVSPITFNLTVAIDATAKTATISGSHTCFPAHEIMIGSQVVYNKLPSAVTFAELSRCLVGSPITDTRISSCTVLLDGISTCP